MTVRGCCGGPTETVCGTDGKKITYADGTVTTIVYGGRLVTITEGTGAEARVSRLEYNSEGYIARTIDSLGRATSFEYDAAGRVITEVLPDGRRIPYTYDAHGNVTSITPPGRPAHSSPTPRWISRRPTTRRLFQVEVPTRPAMITISIGK